MLAIHSVCWRPELVASSGTFDCPPPETNGFRFPDIVLVFGIRLAADRIRPKTDVSPCPKAGSAFHEE